MKEAWQFMRPTSVCLQRDNLEQASWLCAGRTSPAMSWRPGAHSDYARPSSQWIGGLMTDGEAYKKRPPAPSTLQSSPSALRLVWRLRFDNRYRFFSLYFYCEVLFLSVGCSSYENTQKGNSQFGYLLATRGQQKQAVTVTSTYTYFLAFWWSTFNIHRTLTTQSRAKASNRPACQDHVFLLPNNPKTGAKKTVAPFWYHKLIYTCNPHVQAKENVILTRRSVMDLLHALSWYTVAGFQFC